MVQEEGDIDKVKTSRSKRQLVDISKNQMDSRTPLLLAASESQMPRVEVEADNRAGQTRTPSPLSHSEREISASRCDIQKGKVSQRKLVNQPAERKQSDSMSAQPTIDLTEIAEALVNFFRSAQPGIEQFYLSAASGSKKGHDINLEEEY